MKPLQSIQQAMIWACMCSPDYKLSKWEKLVRFICGCTFSPLMSGALLSSIAFFTKYVLIDFEESLYAIFEMAGAIGVIYLDVVALFSQREISEIFRGLNEIYEKCKYFEAI